MIRKKTPSTVSFLKYLGLLSFISGIFFTYISVMGNSLTVDYPQYFPSWYSLDLSLLMQEEGSIFSAVFFGIAYLSSSLLYKFPELSHYQEEEYCSIFCVQFLHAKLSKIVRI